MPARRGATETVSFGRDRSRPRWWGPAALVAVLLGGALVLADATARSGEFDDLMVAVEATQTTVALSERKLSSMRQYVRPLMSSTDASSPVGLGLRDLVRDVGLEGAARVAEQREAVTATRILPWHSAQRTARARYLDYLDAKAEHLAVAGALDAVDDPKENRVDQAREDAVSALLAAASGDAQSARAEAALGGPWS